MNEKDLHDGPSLLIYHPQAARRNRDVHNVETTYTVKHERTEKFTRRL